MNMLFDFTVDKSTNTISITREFAAGIDLVWDAFTKAELLEKWWAPKPLRIETKEMDFREGGRWMYAMKPPEDTVFWSLVEFGKIDPKTSFSSTNSFCDEKGERADTGFTSSETTTSFSGGAETTTVRIVKMMADLAQLESFIALGFKEGTDAVMKNLDELLKEISRQEEGNGQ